jgi:hypothetical protein
MIDPVREQRVEGAGGHRLQLLERRNGFRSVQHE